MSIHDDGERGSMSSSDPPSGRPSSDLQAALGRTDSMINRARKYLDPLPLPSPESRLLKISVSSPPTSETLTLTKRTIMSIHEDGERGRMSSSDPPSGRPSSDLEAALGRTDSMRNRSRKYLEDTVLTGPGIKLSHYTNLEVEKRVYLLMAFHCAVNLALAIPGELPSPLMDGLNLSKIWNQDRHYRYEVILHGLCDMLSFTAIIMNVYVASALFWRAEPPLMRPFANDRFIQILRNSFLFTSISVLLRMLRLYLTVPFICFGLLVVIAATVIHVRPMRHPRQD